MAEAAQEAGLAQILDGNRIARAVREQVRHGVERLVTERGVRPALAVILVGDDPASEIYVATKQRACERVG
ncbi:MAG TPA: tetrahydrofolate dehydrogenase/cyclohydrolase catalytic domain-containing protein, partial [Candidatus Binataceae bacterium]|nr:tetrahydrofolate dehydrogenase/cyclohydrolase catalytic domain-containing protein [Candidatus Binataceae bacterium]